MIVEFEAEWPGTEWRLRLSPCGCGRAACHEHVLLAGHLGQWVAIATATHDGGGELEEMWREVLEVVPTIETFAIAERVLPLIGLRWEDLSTELVTAGLHFWMAAPAWFADEVMQSDPVCLRALRAFVLGDQGSVVEALRAIRQYRTSVDRLPAVGYREGQDG